MINVWNQQTLMDTTTAQKTNELGETLYEALLGSNKKSKKTSGSRTKGVWGSMFNEHFDKGKYHKFRTYIWVKVGTKFIQPN